MKKGKKAQVTIFIIIGIIILVGIILIFYLNGKKEPSQIQEENPSKFIKNCVEDSLQPSIKRIMDNGGEIIQTQSIRYKEINYTYLCYQADYYSSCYNTHPMLEFQIESELKKDTEKEVENCFDSLEDDLNSKGFDVSLGKTDYSIDLVPGSIEYKLSKKVDLKKEELSQKFDKFDGSIVSSSYDLVKIARDIVNSESQFCNFEYNGYMLLYPEYDIKRMDVDGSKIYILIDRRSNEEFKFAVRSCVYPPGI